jgi:hypothetical protein
MTLKDLTELKFKTDRERYPSMPLHAIARKRFTDSTANGLTTAIIAFCELKDIFAMRTGSEGRYRQGSTVVDVIGRTRVMKGSYLPGHSVGQGDIQLTLNGKTISVEVKIGKDRQSDKQKEFQSKLQKAGGIYVIVKSWEDFYNCYKLWVK